MKSWFTYRRTLTFGLDDKIGVGIFNLFLFVVFLINKYMYSKSWLSSLRIFLEHSISNKYIIISYKLSVVSLKAAQRVSESRRILLVYSWSSRVTLIKCCVFGKLDQVCIHYKTTKCSEYDKTILCAQAVRSITYCTWQDSDWSRTATWLYLTVLDFGLDLIIVNEIDFVQVDYDMDQSRLTLDQSRFVLTSLTSYCSISAFVLSF